MKILRWLCVVHLSFAVACSPSNSAISADFADFPSDPVAAGSVLTDNVSALASAFDAAVQKDAGGPCITEPTFGALYPRNFTPPLFEWASAAGQDVYELRLHVNNQKNDLRVYTDGDRFTLPADVWTALATHSADRDIAVSIRSGHREADGVSGPVYAGSAGSVHVAPVDAVGAIVYWTTTGGSALKGFRIGDAQVKVVLTPQAITAAGKPTACVGCHASSPDGTLAFFSRSEISYSVDARAVDGTAATASAVSVTQNALMNLARVDQNLPTFSKAHYTDVDAVVITALNHADTGNKPELVWTDLHAQTGGTGIIARTGDPNGAAVPAWSHGGDRIVYTSSAFVANGRLDAGNADLWQVPYNNRMGGMAVPVSGVNDPGSNQFYPALSPGDALLAFNRVARGQSMYNAVPAEVWVAPGAGGMPVRVTGNDPPACGAQKSPGITNSWPRWAPEAPEAGGKHYYWLVFSSRRRPLRDDALAFPPQLFLSAVITRGDPGSEVIEATYPAVYITTQVPTEANHTPAWDNFRISYAN